MKKLKYGSWSRKYDVIAIAMIITLISSCKTSGRTQANSPKALLQDTFLVDTDVNNYPVKLLSDGKRWMTSNLRLKIPGSYCYENLDGNCERYGRLYTWEAAQQGCKLLGEGWRLPAREEWLQLTMLYGNFSGDSMAARKEAFAALLYPGTSRFNAVLGGGRAPDSIYARIDAHGFYWTATESDSRKAFYYNFAKGSQALYQQYDGEKNRAFSVRCVKDGLLPK